VIHDVSEDLGAAGVNIRKHLPPGIVRAGRRRDCLLARFVNAQIPPAGFSGEHWRSNRAKRIRPRSEVG
jgi:hypothetical protein